MCFYYQNLRVISQTFLSWRKSVGPLLSAVMSPYKMCPLRYQLRHLHVTTDECQKAPLATEITGDGHEAGMVAVFLSAAAINCLASSSYFTKLVVR